MKFTFILESTDIIETSSASQSSSSQPTTTEEESPNSKTLINIKPSSFEMNAVKKHESPHIKVKEMNTTLVNSDINNNHDKASENVDKALSQQQKDNKNDKGASSSDVTSAAIGVPALSNLKQMTEGNDSLSNSIEDSKSPKPLGATGNNKTNSSSNTSGTAGKKCEWDGKFISNHTLVGGINSGDFREHSKATTIDQCMESCCKEEDCDLSFMIDTDCYTVKCTRSDLCQTRKAKTTTFVPKIAYKRRSNVIVENESK